VSDRVLDQLDPKRVIFIGVSSTPICYYRALLPATAMGADWIGVEGHPPALRIDTGLVKGETRKPNLLGGDYDVIVMQEVFGEHWLKLIHDAQARGIRVVYEINDYLHGIPSLRDHHFAKYFTPERIEGIEQCMEAADAVTVTTKWLKKKYQKFAKRIYVCPNGIDINRYELEPPPKLDGEGVTFGWAGATGHFEALVPWLQQVIYVMDLTEQANFATIGQPITQIEFEGEEGEFWSFEDKFGKRAMSVPFCAIEQYPAAMTLLDVALAPAGNTRFHRGKSDLRWVEASALGIPVIASSLLYPEIQNGVTGLIASRPEQVMEYMLMLAGAPETRKEIGEAARTHVREYRTIQALLPKWERALRGD
jgi:glycosyltransferase involved in cell wall biosynthesis